MGTVVAVDIGPVESRMIAVAVAVPAEGNWVGTVVAVDIELAELPQPVRKLSVCRRVARTAVGCSLMWEESCCFGHSRNSF